uniref:Protein DA1-like domain-containing protein n=1 Tax=Craspedostauros australis TaxID=1486917 RepID=A0A7R9ZT84_9STRA|eukprot:CAMPEP_0198130188 /NCGR_PEP_ID=MMETSP1442-20131203/53373_1 /TAXON_ID= /ORGANISM="Craspedostauros australis, Strain CCMP3328" /LENGTH=167 /DNA_ID=CAMNT_0043790741 /DNA_START=12 /DNA_END=515 /DNA_ORIENTATION=+
MNRMKFDKNNMSLRAVDKEARGFTYFQVPDADKVNPDSSVTAILCLSGLPKDLVASVLAHEATHAWIKLHPKYDMRNPIPPQVEEGCAQLIALLFLNDGLDPAPPLKNNDGTGPSDEKLRQYFRFSIETDDNDIYGTGYRKAAQAYSKVGVLTLMTHVVMYQNFPTV